MCSTNKYNGLSEKFGSFAQKKFKLGRNLNNQKFHLESVAKCCTIKKKKKNCSMIDS